MSISLTWKNDNGARAVIKVYRSVGTPIDTSNPGEPIATLPYYAKSYEDTTALPGVDYYYAVSATVDGNVTFTPVLNIENIRKRGPGPQKIIHGNERLGFFGRVNHSELPDILRAMKSSVTRFYNQETLFWYKVVRKGKIYYFPSATPAITNSTGLSTAQIADTFGVDDGINWSFGASKANHPAKGVILEAGGSKFRVRLMRMLPDDWDGLSSSLDRSKEPDTEFHEIFQMCTADTFLKHPVGSVVPFDMSSGPYFISSGAESLGNWMYSAKYIANAQTRYNCIEPRNVATLLSAGWAGLIASTYYGALYIYELLES